ncbi:MAG: hypothetical protein ACHQHN_02365 [Sphingobacteriales bacterium]
MKTIKKHIAIKLLIGAIMVFMLPAQKLFAQAEFKPWGNIDGIRVKGQLMDFNTRLVVLGNSWSKVSFTGKERQKPKYTRIDGAYTVSTWIDSLEFTETVKNIGKGAAKVTVKCTVHADTTVKGIYFNLSLPEDIYKASLDQSHLDNNGYYLNQNTKELSFTSASQNIRVKADTVSSVFGRPDAGSTQKYIRLYFPICSGTLHKSDVFERTYEIKVSGTIDQSPVNITLDTSVQGRAFAGLGGNFRIQNPSLDPEVIDYCLKNLRVAYGRVEMPWSAWQPDSSADPSTSDTSKLNIRVRRAMTMAQTLGRMNIPVILTAWFPPAWAAEGKLQFQPTPQGIWGNPLNKAAMPKIYKSITDYIIYLRDHYGVEPQCFSFNESDLGINVRQTGEEHDELIKGLGAYFASRGLKTKLLLGDNSDATTWKFVYPAMNDAQAQQYIGLVSFHSWRGWGTGTLQKWADVAKQTGKPLIVGEGSIDAAAWGYPAYFQDPSYAIEEINLYTRLLAICQPLSILQWQLTTDYSPLKGGGIFGDNGPLEPTQRFWNLKQLACTPEGLFYMPLTSDNDAVSCAALGDNSKHVYTLHMVNNAASREVHLTGLPAGVKEFKMYITDEKDNMKLSKTIKVQNHESTFTLKERCFATLFSN